MNTDEMNTAPGPVKAYIYMSYDNMLKVLVGRCLKVRTIEECNDPYECMPAGPDGKMWQKISRIGFLCFSQTCTCGAMWGHYADKHKGVCLEFTFPRLDVQPYIDLSNDEKYHYHVLNIGMGKDAFVSVPFSPNVKKKCAFLFDVIYRNNRITPGLGMTAYFEDQGRMICDIDKAFVTKDSSWNYEKESRILLHLKRKEKYVTCFHKYLTGVILGVKCLEKAEVIRKIIDKFRKSGDRSVTVYNAKYSKQTFNMDIRGL